MKINKIGTWTVALTFIIGTICFLTSYISGANQIAFAAYGFIVIAAILNLIFLFALIIKSIKNKENRKTYKKTCWALIVNMVVLVFYFYFILALLNTIRLTLINDTGKLISDVEITGCQPKTINELKIGESKTTWIEITSDCSIIVEYTIDGELKSEVALGYTTINMGEKVTYRIKQLN